jgi:hypothetical protein
VRHSLASIMYRSMFMYLLICFCAAGLVHSVLPTDMKFRTWAALLLILGIVFNASRFVSREK